MTPYKMILNEVYDLQKFAIKLGLQNIKALCEFLGNPQRAYPSIHIAGTNGKGSTSFFISRLLQAAGLRVGLFTSPHLYDFRERIRVDDQLIPREFVVDFWQRTKTRVMQRKATFFDTTTAMAFDYFKAENVDVAVVETGLGGRLDSTNILQAQLSVLTPVDYDHQKQLGDSLESIAAEKAGIIKKGGSVFCAGQKTPALKKIREYLPEAAPFYYLPELVSTNIRSRSLQAIQFDLFDKHNKTDFKDLRTRQTGDFQVDNIAMAYLAVRHYLALKGIAFDEHSFRTTLQNALWPGRLQLVSENPAVIIDVSHNLQGIRNSLAYLRKAADKKKAVVLIGLLRDKDYFSIAAEISDFASRVIVSEPDTERKLPCAALLKAFAPLNIKVECIKEIRKAYELSKNTLAADEMLLVIGSHYLVGGLENSAN